MMKKKLVAILLASLCFILTACQKEQEAKTSSKAAEVSEHTDSLFLNTASDSSTASYLSSAEPVERNLDNTAIGHMLGDLLTYVSKCEEIYGDVLWTLESLEKFDEARSWEQLLLARGTVELAAANVAAGTFPDAQMTADDQAKLMEDGVDASFLEYSRQAFEEEQETAKNMLINLKYDVMEGVLLNADWAAAMRKTAVLKKVCEADLQYLANTVEWTLASLADSALEESFRKTLQENCPRTFTFLQATLRSTEEIEAVTEELIQGMGNLSEERAEINGVYEDRVKVLKAQIEANDYQAIGEDILTIDGKPQSLCYPAGVNHKNFTYFWMEDGASFIPVARTELEKAPNACRIEAADVNREAVEDYFGILEKAGLTKMEVSDTEGAKEEDGKVFCSFQYDGGVLDVEYTDNGTGKGTLVLSMAQNPLFFADSWYIAAEETRE